MSQKSITKCTSVTWRIFKWGRRDAIVFKFFKNTLGSPVSNYSALVVGFSNLLNKSALNERLGIAAIAGLTFAGDSYG